ncbi:hypothetical protein LXL04_006779 [Taraxacum kok-saghyz]
MEKLVIVALEKVNKVGFQGRSVDHVHFQIKVDKVGLQRRFVDQQTGTFDVYEKKFEFSSTHGVELLQMTYDEIVEFILTMIKENKHQLRLVMKGGGGGGGGVLQAGWFH